MRPEGMPAACGELSTGQWGYDRYHAIPLRYSTGFAVWLIHKVVATLFGDRGDTTRYRFRLSVPERAMPGGGVGDCQVSDGGQLTAQFYAMWQLCSSPS
jgi:hypothetical protein